MMVRANTNSAAHIVVESSTNRILASGGDSGGEPPAETAQPPPSTAAAAVDPNDPIKDKDNHQPILFTRKQLVLFAGPHKSASTSVEEFMAEWAEHGWKKGHPHTKAYV